MLIIGQKPCFFGPTIFHDKTDIIGDKKTTSKIIHPIVSGEQLNCNHYLHSSTSYTR